MSGREVVVRDGMAGETDCRFVAGSALVDWMDVRVDGQSQLWRSAEGVVICGKTEDEDVVNRCNIGGPLP